MITEKSFLEAKKALDKFGDKTRALVVHSMSDQGDVITFYGGSDGDVLVMNALGEENAKLRMMGFIRKTPAEENKSGAV